MSWNLLNVTGKVTDEDGAPLQGVTIEKLSFGRSTGQYVTTDPAGLFNIPITGFNGLKFSHVGYQEETCLDAQLFSGIVNVTMVKDVQLLPGVTITVVKKNWLVIAIAAGLAYYAYKKKLFK